MSEAKGLQYWVEKLTHADLPVLKQTARDLNALRDNEEKLTPQAIVEIIARDPMITVKLLRYLQQHKHKSQTAEIIQVEQALLMLGIEPFFNKVPPEPLVETCLKSNITALSSLLRVVHRSHRASEYAREWAAQLHDLRYEEVRIAALLHDITEILMWCFDPEDMQQISTARQKNPSLHSRDIQQQVLGFALDDLQKELVTQWGLPQLLLTLMNSSGVEQPRVRNVTLAVNLARHSANGWDNAALPDDYQAIGELLRMSAAQVMIMLEEDAGVVCDIGKLH